MYFKTNIIIFFSCDILDIFKVDGKLITSLFPRAYLPVVGPFLRNFYNLNFLLLACYSPNCALLKGKKKRVFYSFFFKSPGLDVAWNGQFSHCQCIIYKWQFHGFKQSRESLERIIAKQPSTFYMSQLRPQHIDSDSSSLQELGCY